jgi:hypothetical protein
MQQPVLIVPFSFADPVGDKTEIVCQVPSGGSAYTVVGASISRDVALDADGTNGCAFSILNAGAAGAGTTAITNTLGGATVDAANDWAASVPKVFTVDPDNAVVAPGHFIAVKHDKSGTDSFKNATGCLHLVAGRRGSA